MRKYIPLFTLLLGAIMLLTWKVTDPPAAVRPEKSLGKTVSYREIKSSVKEGETLYDIFKKNDIEVGELVQLKQASQRIHKLSDIAVGHSYSIRFDEEDRISEFTYAIDDDTSISIAKTDDGFCAATKAPDYERRIIQFGGIIRENLVSAVGEDGENVRLALRLSDIFVWDIDFTTDLRKGDTFKVVTEGFYHEGNFVKYGDILFAEFTNNGNTYRGYRFECDGKADYFDEKGRSLRKSFLKAPLNFRRISSGFTMTRFHPILKINRPHRGIDYAAETGTPVVSMGDGTVSFAGRKGQYGNLVVVEHAHQYSTYYGHLSKFTEGLQAGSKVEQGEVIGYVGSTGLASGPHLHFEVRVADSPVDPAAIETVTGGRVPERLLAGFRKVVGEGNVRLAGIGPAPIASSSGGVQTLRGPTRPGT